MTIHVSSSSGSDDWDDFIGQFPSAGPFHTRAWAECFENERQAPIYLRLSSQGRPVGGIAGVIVDPILPVLRRIDRKLVFFSGPALADMDSGAIRDCMLHLRDYAEGNGLTSLISPGRDYPYVYDWGATRVHLDAMHEYIVDMRGAWHGIEARMRRSIPEQVRKARRAGLAFDERGDASLLPLLLELLESTRLRRLQKSGVYFSPHYLPLLAEEPLRRLAASPIARFFVARRGTEVLCVLLTFAFRKRAYALWIGCNEEGYRQRAPAFVWFHAMQALWNAGVEFLNLAGGGPESGVGFAKASLGAERQACTGSVSPYLQGPVRNLLFQACRSMEHLIATAPLLRGRNSIRP